jgi:hypothetical protein
MIWHPEPIATRAVVYMVLIAALVAIGVYFSGYGDCC